MTVNTMTSIQTLKLRSAALTDCGQERSVNEDSVFQFTDYTQAGENIGLYIVCDGMGGHEAGDIASQLAVQALAAALENLLTYEEETPGSGVLVPKVIAEETQLAKWLQNAVLQANKSIRQKIEDSSISKMGTTVNAVFIYNNQAYIANVGDSRAYHWRNGGLNLITSDHSVAHQMVKEHLIPPENGHTHHMRNVLTQAVNGKDSLETIDIFEKRLSPGDRLLLCSDGLWLAYPDQAELAERLAHYEHPADLCWQLITEANDRDGSDNISAVAVYVSA